MTKSRDELLRDPSSHPRLTVSVHPLVRHKLALLRNRDCTTKAASDLVHELSLLMAHEATVDLDLVDVDVNTPLESTKCKTLSGKKLVLVPVLRAGLGMLDAFRQVIPSARVGHIGLARDEDTLLPVEYYLKLPDALSERDVLVLDPMLATGGSACAAVEALKGRGAKSVSLVCLVAAPEGVTKLGQAHPDVSIFAAALDRGLNEVGYIVPGLGDAGDRLFGTN